MTKAICTTCGGALFVTEDAYGYGSVLGCVACSRQPPAPDWQPMAYTFHEPILPRVVDARDLSGACIDCRAAIGSRATRCNLCTGRAYEARRKVRDRARRAETAQT